MTQYKVWCPDYADEDDARTVEAWAPDDAAEMLAEHYHNEEAFDHPIEIHVKTMAGARGDAEGIGLATSLRRRLLINLHGRPMLASALAIEAEKAGNPIRAIGIIGRDRRYLLAR